MMSVGAIVPRVIAVEKVIAMVMEQWVACGHQGIDQRAVVAAIIIKREGLTLHHHRRREGIIQGCHGWVGVVTFRRHMPRPQ
jgi:hypothetical protein